MSDELKVGVIGVGSLGQHHARVYSELKQCCLVGVYDVDREQSERVAEKHQTVAYDSMEALSHDVEAVSIVVPTDRHREVAGMFIQKGVHSLVEKPIAATTAEAEELVALAEAHDVMLQVGHIERFNPVMAYLEKVSDKPRFIEAHRLASYPPPREGLHPRGTEVSVILDLMIHDIEIILHLVQSPVRSIQAVGVPVLSPTEDIANVRLSFENGCVANLTVSRISPERMRKIRVFYEDAYISLDYQNQSGELYRKSESGIESEEVPINKAEPLMSELSNFADCVLHHKTPRVTGAHAAQALKMAIQIIQQLKAGPS